MEDNLRKFRLSSKGGEEKHQVKRGGFQRDQHVYLTCATETAGAHSVGRKKESLAGTECKREILTES